MTERQAILFTKGDHQTSVKKKIHAKVNDAMSHKYITSKNTTNSKKQPRFVSRSIVYAVSIKRSVHV